MASCRISKEVRDAVRAAEARAAKEVRRAIREHARQLHAEVFASFPALSASYHLSKLRDRRFI